MSCLKLSQLKKIVDDALKDYGDIEIHMDQGFGAFDQLTDKDFCVLKGQEESGRMFIPDIFSINNPASVDPFELLK